MMRIRNIHMKSSKQIGKTPNRKVARIDENNNILNKQIQYVNERILQCALCIFCKHHIAKDAHMNIIERQQNSNYYYEF